MLLQNKIVTALTAEFEGALRAISGISEGGLGGVEPKIHRSSGIFVLVRAIADGGIGEQFPSAGYPESSG